MIKIGRFSDQSVVQAFCERVRVSNSMCCNCVGSASDEPYTFGFVDVMRNKHDKNRCESDVKPAVLLRIA